MRDVVETEYQADILGFGHQKSYAQFGNCYQPSSRANAAAVRLFGTDLLTVRIDLDE
jgi:hypothetical protein